MHPALVSVFSSGREKGYAELMIFKESKGPQELW